MAFPELRILRDPISLVLAGSAIGGASSIVGGVAAYQQSRQEARAAEANARFSEELGERNAEQALLTAGSDEERLRRQRLRELSSARVGFAARGVSIGTGSVLDVLGDLAAEQEEEALLVRFRGEREAEQARLGGAVTARRERLGAIRARAAGDAALLEGIGGGIGGSIEGVGTALLV